MNRVKQIYYRASGLLPLPILARSSPVSSVFPYHHIVSDERVPHIIHLYSYKSTRDFKSDLDYLLKNFDPIAPEELVRSVRNGCQLPSRKFLLTFDDGFKEIREVVAPILKEKGLPAIFFVNPAFIDNRQMFYRNKISLILDSIKMLSAQQLKEGFGRLGIREFSYETIRESLLAIHHQNAAILDEIAQAIGLSFEDYLTKHQPWLTRQDLAELNKQGFSIGAHSWDHPYYNRIPVQEQIQQTVDSCKYVKEIIGNKPLFFSFPHSDEGLSQSVIQGILDAEPRIDLLFGIQNQKTETSNRMIHRFNCERPGVLMENQVKGLFLYSLIRKLLNKQRVMRHA